METNLNEVGLSQGHRLLHYLATVPQQEGCLLLPSPIFIPAQEIQLGLTLLEMGKYLDVQMYVLSNSPTIQKVSQAVEMLSLEPTHAWEVFPAAGPTGVIKEPIQENAHIQPSKQWPFREMQLALFNYC